MLWLAVKAITAPVLKHTDSQVGESNQDGSTKTTEHSNHASSVLRGLICPECLGTDQVTGRVSDVDDSEDNCLLGSSSSVGLREGDKDNIRGYNVSVCCPSRSEERVTYASKGT